MTLKHNSKIEGHTLSNINGYDIMLIGQRNITPDAVVLPLLLNWTPDQNCKIRNKKTVQKTGSHETILTHFTFRYLGDAIYLLKKMPRAWITSIMK